MRPMLAKKYADFKSRITYPRFVQPKLNGVRCLYNRGKFQSRDQLLWNDGVLAHIETELRTRFDIPNWVVLDGELYVHGWPLQTINGAISINRLTPNDKTASVEYHVFDLFDGCLPSMPFRFRTGAVGELFRYAVATNPPSRVRIVDTYEVHNESELNHYFELFKHQGYEGMISRCNSPYGIETDCTNKQNRWSRLLKHKDWLDDDFDIVGYSRGEGKYSDCVGSLNLVTETGQSFSAGSGLDDLDRVRYWNNPPIGRRAKIRYEMLSSAGIPLKPTIIAVLD